MQNPASSILSAAEYRYPQPPLNASGLLAVSEDPPHKIHWEEYGNPKGEPVLFVHGGPGGGTAPHYARFFDPARYRVILFDQRGCGKSVPSAAAPDPRPALAANTTDDLIADMARLRAELDITGRMHLFGGSWGSTLSLAYAIRHPETVATLVLRGIFLCRRRDLDYFYQGNAATNDTSLPGAYQTFPEPWKDFVAVIPPAKRGDMVKAYAEIFAEEPKDAAARARQLKAAQAWSVWEGATSHLAQDLSDLGKFADPAFARAFALIENHYFMNGAFLGGAGGENRDNNYILENIHRIKDIPVHIVHGRYDAVCPLFQAEDLVAALKKAGAEKIDYRVTVAGHSMFDRANALALTDIMEGLPRI